MTPLRRRMTEDMQVRNFSPHTQDSYVQQVSLFARHFSKSPEVLGPEEIRSYQVYLTNERSWLPVPSSSPYRPALSLQSDTSMGVGFGGHHPNAKRPQKLPIVLSPEEVLQFLI